MRRRTAGLPIVFALVLAGLLAGESPSQTKKGAGGSVAGCQCDANSGCGINIEGDAMPSVEGNECSGNQGHGVCLAAGVGKTRVRGTTGKDNRGDLVRDLRRRRWFG